MTDDLLYSGPISSIAGDSDHDSAANGERGVGRSGRRAAALGAGLELVVAPWGATMEERLRRARAVEVR